VDFADTAVEDECKIAVGLQDGKSRVFVTRFFRADLLRYTIEADGTGTLDAVIPELHCPSGVDATTSNTVPTPAGNNVSVEPTKVMTSTFEQVIIAGKVKASVTTFVDPRESERTIAPNLPLHRSLFLNELRADLPPIEIPAYARAFPFDNPATGVPTFILIEADSDIGLSGVVDNLADEEPFLGYSPNCADPDLTRQPFMFWCPDANDAPIVEGKKFIDVTTGCGTIRGLTRGMSYFLVGVRITAPQTTVAKEKLASLRTVINTSACIDRLLRRKLIQQLDQAEQYFKKARYSQAITSLEALDKTVEASAKSFSTCTVNVSGEIQARARSANFTLSKCK
jgi:hypothetical protein